MNITQDPVVTKEIGPIGGERITHPSFAQIKADRVSGNSTLYDSEFNHHNTIRVTVSSSEMVRTLSRNYHFEADDLITIEMSEAQWATFVSSLNVGSGVPCSLRRDHGEGIPALSRPITQREKFKVEFDEKITNAIDRLGALESMITDAKLSAKAQKEMVDAINYVKRSFTSSMPFVAEKFAEHMETTVEKAKIEINAFTTQALIDAGRQSLSSAGLNLGDGRIIKGVEE